MIENFWELTGDGREVITDDERAMEVLRRCSTAKVFKQVLASFGGVIDLARRIYPHKLKPLFIRGTFELGDKIDTSYGATIIPTRLVKIMLKIYDEKGEFVIGSHFYLVVTDEGHILGLRRIPKSPVYKLLS